MQPRANGLRYVHPLRRGIAGSAFRILPYSDSYETSVRALVPANSRSYTYMYCPQAAMTQLTPGGRLSPPWAWPLGTQVPAYPGRESLLRPRPTHLTGRSSVLSGVELGPCHAMPSHSNSCCCCAAPGCRTTVGPHRDRPKHHSSTDKSHPGGTAPGGTAAQQSTDPYRVPAAGCPA